MRDLSFDLARLSAGYADGAATVGAVAREMLRRIAAAGEDHVWTSRRDDAAILRDAAALDARTAEQRRALPLFGVPFAVKDNIDVAGMPTTAACPDFAFTPPETAPTVTRLLDAGAVLIGKTNMDQFATGLVGVRSPYGTPRNPFDAAMLPGGSSSGSAVAVASGLVGFALGTDTAGSGRVPASFNNIVGLKPTRGLISPRGMLPACRSLDCISIFALTVDDALAVLQVAYGFDADEGFSRAAPAGFAVHHADVPAFRFGVPRVEQRQFFGDAEAAALFAAAIARAEAAGGSCVPIDFAPFIEVSGLLYGAFVAERTATVGRFLAERPDALHPVTRAIIAGGTGISATDLLRAQYRLAELAQAIRPVWDAIDALLVPTTGTAFSLKQVAAEPVARNSELGFYTNFTNLLDLSAIAVPGGFTRGGFPVGVTLLGPAWHDARLAAIGRRLQRDAGTPLGATGHPQPDLPVQRAARSVFPMTEIVVFGAHLDGQPLNAGLRAMGGMLRRPCRTAPRYRMVALPGAMARPGVLRRDADGVALAGEIWALPTASVGAFLATIGPPLGLGTVLLEDDVPMTGFICEDGMAGGAPDISRFGGWRAYRAERL